MVLHKLFIMHGSVFPSACWIAMPCALIAAAVRYFIEADMLEMFAGEDSVVKESQAFSGFTFLVGFLIVFRTSQAYSRFWDGCTYTHNMRAEWFDACSALVAFCNYSRNKVSPALQIRFKGTLVRLFSMLHALALAELEEVNTDVEKLDSAAFSYEVLDPRGLDKESLRTVKASGSRVELIFSWIQCLVVENIDTGVLSIPPPILSRAFQEIANGMVAFHDAMKITYIPFPFPYAQTCDCVLCMHWLVAPFVMSQWVTSPVWAFIFVFIQVFIFWCLNLIAIEIENPFGTDPNDLDGHNMQDEMNRHLLLLLKAETVAAPVLQECASSPDDAAIGNFGSDTLSALWEELGPEVQGTSERHHRVQRQSLHPSRGNSLKKSMMIPRTSSLHSRKLASKISAATTEPSGSRGLDSGALQKQSSRLSSPGGADSRTSRTSQREVDNAGSKTSPRSPRSRSVETKQGSSAVGDARPPQVLEAQDRLPSIEGDPTDMQELVLRGQWEPVPPAHEPASTLSPPVAVERRPGHITWLS
mmetsp:Transcript_23983/g.55358  ORF Transcript_23983/g.55358 Transcript_23983/m.55358 type:complete len:530 (-) Transcript_23983:132-1721(-)